MNYTSRDVYEYISKQTNDPIVEWKTCTVSGTEFAIYQSDMEFYDKMSPTFQTSLSGGEGSRVRFQIPTPTLCPEERQRRRVMFRNERKLYKRTCDFSGKSMISTYPIDCPYTIYDQSIRRSDQRDPLQYGFEFDFSKTFTENFAQLALSVPKCNLLTDYNKLERSDFVHMAGESKDCYLIMETDRCEKCMYGYAIFDCVGCIDCNNSSNSHYCYECIDCKDCYQLLYCYQCHSCKDSIACISCQNISNCFGCHNLNGGEYMIYNKQHTAEEYQAFMKQLDRSQLPSIINDVIQQTSYKYLSGVGNNPPVFGSYINNSHNAVFCYDADEVRDCKYCTIIGQSQDCMDYLSRGQNSSRMYETHNCGNACQNLMFCDFVRDTASNVLYSHLCPVNNKNLFGCIGLRNKQYCIFNKQYENKEKYEEQVSKIIAHMQDTGEWGEFFHPSLSPFGYNETVAHEYYPITKQQALDAGLKRQDQEYPINIPEGMETIKASDLPTIDQVDDSILNKAIICDVSGKPFRLVKLELDFYRTHRISIPHQHPEVRHAHRLSLRPEKILYKRQCDACTIDLVSTYPTNYPSKVYCETCYQKEIYG